MDAGFLIDSVSKRPPDFVIGDPANPYLLRWHLVPRNAEQNIYLHHILRSDDDRALHDHPWDNMSVLLRGEYFEAVDRSASGPLIRTIRDGVFGYERREGSIVERKAETLHRLILRPGETCWSLFLTGPWKRDWGFQCGERWVHWREFVSEDGRTVGRGCGG